MQIKSIQFVMVLLAGVFLTATASVSAAVDSGTLVKPLWIGGHAYEALLEASQINEVAGSGEDVHYQGHFPEDPDSWVRVSRIDGSWEGLAFVFNRLHSIRSGGNDQVASFSFSHQETPQCGLDHMHADASITPDSLASTAMAQAVTANYDTLCTDKVDGACLMLELELAFDLQFQSRFSSDFKSRAGAILNMVEGFYKARFGIVFDTLSLTYMDNDLFSSTLDAGMLLDDIAQKRGNGAVGFLESDRSIFHLVSGRDFDGSTAGVAYVGSVCNSFGFASGVTNAFNSNATTAVVIAHEIGHNLGSGHDGTGSSDNGCPVSGKIMSPSVSGSASEFSSCSFEQISSQISALSSVEQCFNFPADAGIAALAGNPAEVTRGEVFQASFDLAYRDSSQPADRLAVEGSIGEGEGRLQEVTLGGAACTLTSDTGFRCDGAQARTGQRLSVSATPGNLATLNLMQGVALVSDSGDVKDIRSANDILQTRFAVAEGDNTTTDEPSAPEAPQRDTDGSTTTASGGSSGGGGSVGWFWLLAGIAGFGRLATRSA
ncbi:M12 family metallo-peptidase [Marinobacter halotolerans]|uniref:M12 family metallo-peptidase n=1 Tax=Marinobacter halotolerans TaxID=1569211 RepID=UPI00124443DC|nr:M12 family metallo-peptidase [Marinobacter halotolerans]